MKDSDGDRPDRKRTIVGGRPKAEGGPGADIPRGVEIVLKMAAIDPTFRKRLIHMRGQASRDLGFKLKLSEAMILEAVPEDQLQAMIDAMQVSDDERARLSALAPEKRLPSDSPLLATMGIRPEWNADAAALRQTRGIRPDDVPPRGQTKGIRPEDD
jgi:hypothetical protein